jgi:hypothetical protein
MMATEAQQNSPRMPKDAGQWAGAVFIREAILEGVHGWAVFDADGALMFRDPMRCQAWLYIATNGLRAMPRH